MVRILKILICCLLMFTSLSMFGGERRDTTVTTIKDTVLTGRLEFVVNTATVIKNDTYYHFINDILPQIRENSDRVSNVVVVSSTSPEGNTKRNRFLEEIRAQEAISFIDDIVDKDKITIVKNRETFLSMLNLEESDWAARRGTLIKVWLNGKTTVEITDTIETHSVDTVYLHDTIRIKPRVIPILGVKTNLVSDIVIAPNVQAELYTHLKGISLEFSYTFPWWYDDNIFVYYQILNGAAGIRKYLKDDYTGHYFGVYGNTAIYDICFNRDEGYQGESHGCGLSYGYVFAHPKHPRLKFELYARVGWLYTKYDTYHAGNPFEGKYYYNWYKKASDFVPRRFELNYFGPTALGFNLTYDLVCLRKY